MSSSGNTTGKEATGAIKADVKTINQLHSSGKAAQGRRKSKVKAALEAEKAKKIDKNDKDKKT